MADNLSQIPHANTPEEVAAQLSLLVGVPHLEAPTVTAPTAIGSEVSDMRDWVLISWDQIKLLAIYFGCDPGDFVAKSQTSGADRYSLCLSRQEAAGSYEYVYVSKPDFKIVLREERRNDQRDRD